MSDIVVSVVTPFFNTEEYLAECIEGVLNQSLGEFEYILVDNCSTDGSRGIAERYAERDSRIRFVHFSEHVDQLPNYNRALRLANPDAKYCKIAQADDILLPDCLHEMVTLADSDEEIGMVGAYTILQNQVFLDGLDYYEDILDGREVGRRYLMGGPYILGSPTTCMYRMDEVKARSEFYPERSELGDADVALQILSQRKFGFVHQVLSFVRTSNDSISTQRAKFGIATLSRRVLLAKYGDRFLDPLTLRRERRRWTNRHYRLLGEGVLLRRPQRFWDLHMESLAEAGLGFSRWRVALGAIVVALRWLFNLESTFRGNWSWS